MCEAMIAIPLRTRTSKQMHKVFWMECELWPINCLKWYRYGSVFGCNFYQILIFVYEHTDGNPFIGNFAFHEKNILGKLRLQFIVVVKRSRKSQWNDFYFRFFFLLRNGNLIIIHTSPNNHNKKRNEQMAYVIREQCKTEKRSVKYVWKNGNYRHLLRQAMINTHWIGT